MKTALLASYEKDDNVLRLGKLLTENGWNVLGSSGTAKFLNENGVNCRDVADIVGPPILGHRVVTLSRELFAGLLATEADQGELEQLDVPCIDLVYVTLYPLEKTVASPSATVDDVIEKTDIGGPTLLRAAAKGRRFALSNHSQISEFEQCLKAGMPKDIVESLTTRFAAAAERRVAEYVAASASFWEDRAAAH